MTDMILQFGQAGKMGLGVERSSTKVCMLHNLAGNKVAIKVYVEVA